MKDSNEEPRVKGAIGVLNYSIQHGYRSAVNAILKTNLIDYDTVKNAAIEAHKKDTGIYNILSNHMRSMRALVVPKQYAFYQPAPMPQDGFSKQSGRRVRAHR